MSRLVFGRDEPPIDAGERMAYIARAGCGHIRVIQVDTGPKAVDDFVASGVAGLTLERIPVKAALLEGIEDCDRCSLPKQTEAFG